MQTEFFKNWLKVTKSFSDHIIACRISDCRRVEKYYGDLDKIIEENGQDWLLNELSYSAQNEKNQDIPKIPIKGNIRNSYACMKKAVKLYFMVYED